MIKHIFGFNFRLEEIFYIKSYQNQFFLKQKVVFYPLIRNILGFLNISLFRNQELFNFLSP